MLIQRIAVGHSRDVVRNHARAFGAASGPFVVQALPRSAREKLALAAFLSPGARANFWAGPWSWLGVGFGPKVAPVMTALAPTPVLCIGGAGVFGDVCPQTAPAGMVSVHLAGGHLLTNQYDEIARLIIQEGARREFSRAQGGADYSPRPN